MEGADVVVVGAGLAGLECAAGLAARGLSVILGDRRLDRHVRTTGIFVRRTLEDFALPVDCLGPPVRRVALYSPARRLLPLESHQEEFRVGRMARLYQRRLDRCLRLGVRWMPGASYEGSEPAPGGSVVTFSEEGRRHRVAARFLVGADGGRSRVGSDLGLETNSKWISCLEEVYEGGLTGKEPTFHCFLDPVLAPGYLAWLVDDGESVHAGVGGYPGRFRPEAALAAFKADLPRELSLEDRDPVERRGGSIPVGGVLTRIASPRGLLVGDAAGAVSPLTAGGLDACLRLSAFAAQVILSHLEGYPAALDTYSGSRFRSRFISRLAMRRILQAAGSPLLLELACAGLRCWPLSGLARHVFFGRGSFPLPARALAPPPA